MELLNLKEKGGESMIKGSLWSVRTGLHQEEVAHVLVPSAGETEANFVTAFMAARTLAGIAINSVEYVSNTWLTVDATRVIM